MLWFLEHRADLARHIGYCERDAAAHGHRLLSIPSRERLVRVLRYVLDEQELLSPFGVRSLSKAYAARPYILHLDGEEHRVDYAPGEGTTELFGGNSNWRGPIWFPINFLLIEALQRFHHYHGDHFTVECPTGSGRFMTLAEVASELSRRLSAIFLEDSRGRRAVFGQAERFQQDPNWSGLIPFHEYFNGDTGAGVGASHQTGWTALVAKLLQQSGEPNEGHRSPAGKTRQRAPRRVDTTLAV